MLVSEKNALKKRPTNRSVNETKMGISHRDNFIK